MKEIFDSDKEDIRELYNNYGHSIRDISESEGLSMKEVKDIIGEKSVDTSRSISSTEVTGKEYQQRLKEEKGRLSQVSKEKQRLSQTIQDFRKNGCALSRCPNCGEIMDDCEVRYDDGEVDFFYRCESCGFIDTENEYCKDKCCRQGLGRLFEEYIPELVKEGYDRDRLYVYVNNFIKTGEK